MRFKYHADDSFVRIAVAILQTQPQNRWPARPLICLSEILIPIIVQEDEGSLARRGSGTH
ncbi:hypothetical protein BH18VER1_BH18VER1_12510 [soil metagenome]